MSNKGGRVSPDYLAAIAPEYAVIPKVDPNKFVAALFVGASSISTKGFAVPVSESQHGLRFTSVLRQQIGKEDGDDCERRKEY